MPQLAEVNNMQKKRTIKQLAKKIYTNDTTPIIIALVLEILVFGLLSPYFFTTRNLLTVIQYCSLVGLVALPMTLLMIGGQFDMSLGSQVALTSCVAGMICPASPENLGGVLLAYLLPIVVGAMIGLLNALFITRVHLGAFISTMAMMQALRGVTYLITNGQSKMIGNVVFGFIGRGKFLGIPITMYIFVLFIVVFWVITKHSVLGRRAYLIGGNPVSARLSGIDVPRTLTWLYIILGAITGFAGALTASQLGAAIPSGSEDFGFDVISAVVLGGVAMSGGKGTIPGAVLGVLVLALLDNGLVMLNVSSHWQLVFSGLVLLLAISIDAIRQQASTRLLK
jgi:ribose transport system permease protein